MHRAGTVAKLIYDELLEMKEGAEANYKSIEHDVKKWLLQKNTSEKKVKAAFRSHLDIYDENGQLTDKAFAVS